MIHRCKEIPMKLVSSSDCWTATKAFTKNHGRKQSFQQHTSTGQITLSRKKAICEIFYYASSQKKKEKEEKIDTDGRTMACMTSVLCIILFISHFNMM